MADIKFKLTSESIINGQGIKLFRIEAIVDIKTRGVKKGDKGGFVESTHLSSGNARVSGNAWVYGDAMVYGNARVYGNAGVYGDARVYGNAWVYGDAMVSGNARVSGNAWVYGDAMVYGNACLSLKAAFKAGWFIGGDDSGKIKNITSETGTDYLKNQYVLGDYEIENIEDKQDGNVKTINIGGKDYKVTDELTKALENLKEV